MDALTLTREDPRTADVQALLTRHFNLMRSGSPAESCHVLEPDQLLEAGAVILGLRESGALLGLGALAVIAGGHGELKSMHTRADARGKGVARKILQGLVDEARSLGLTRISLETGTDETFAAARALYRKEGFAECPPFGSYTHDPLSVFMTRVL